jgi:hypothetical protein
VEAVEEFDRAGTIVPAFLAVAIIVLAAETVPVPAEAGNSGVRVMAIPSRLVPELVVVASSGVQAGTIGRVVRATGPELEVAENNGVLEVTIVPAVRAIVPEPAAVVSSGVPVTIARIVQTALRVLHAQRVRTSGKTFKTTATTNGTSGSRRITSTSTTSKITGSTTGITSTSVGTKMVGRAATVRMTTGSGGAM